MGRRERRARRSEPGVVDLGFLRWRSGFAWRVRIDRERMDALGHQRADGIINEPVPAQPRQAAKRLGLDLHGEVAAFARAGMARVAMAVVDHLDAQRRERLAQHALDVAARRPHGALAHGAPGPVSAAPFAALSAGFRWRLR